MAQPDFEPHFIDTFEECTRLEHQGVIRQVTRPSGGGTFLRDFFLLGRPQDGRRDYVIIDFHRFRHWLWQMTDGDRNFDPTKILRPAIVANATKDTAHSFSLFMDFDSTGRPEVPVDLDDPETWHEFVDGVIDVLTINYGVSRDKLRRVAIVGADHPDKPGPGFHVFFPDVIVHTPEHPFEKFFSKDHIDELTELASSTCIPCKADIGISGLRFWPCDKWVKDQWRGEAYRVLYLRGFEGGDDLSWYLCPLKETPPGTPLDFVRPPQAPRTRRQRDDDNDGVDIGVENEQVKQYLKWHQVAFDPRARVQSVRASGPFIRISFNDSTAVTCKHTGNNHYVLLSLAGAEVHCYGTDDHPRQVSWETINTCAAFAINTDQMMVEEDDSDGDDPDDPLLALIYGDERITVGTPLFPKDFANARLERGAYCTEVHGGVLAISPGTFAHYQAIGVGPHALGRLMSLAVNFSLEFGKYVVRDGTGKVYLVSRQNLDQAAARYVDPPEGTKGSKPFPFSRYCFQASNTVYTRNNSPCAPTDLALPIIADHVPPFPLHPQLSVVREQVSTWWHAFMVSLCGASVPDRETDQDEFIARCAKWIHTFALETLFGYGQMGLMLVLCESVGGAGKSLFANLLEALLGAHQVVRIRSLKQALEERFNINDAYTRLKVADDSNRASADMDAFKDAITSLNCTMEIKNGAKVTKATMIVYILLCNTLGAVPLTDRNRRIAAFVPSRAAHEISVFPSHEAFLGYGYSTILPSFEHRQALVEFLRLEYDQTVREVGDLKEYLRRELEAGLVTTTLLTGATIDNLSEVGRWLNERLLGGRALFDETAEAWAWPGNANTGFAVDIAKRVDRVPGVVPGSTAPYFFGRVTLYELFVLETNKKTIAANFFYREFTRAFDQLSRVYSGDAQKVFCVDAKCLTVAAEPEWHLIQGIQAYRGIQATIARENSRAVQKTGWRLDFSGFATKYASDNNK